MKNKRRITTLLVVLTITAMLLALLPAAVFAQPADIAGHWASSQLQDWVDQGMLSGYPDGTLRPDNQVTRAEFIMLVNRTIEFTAQAEINFTDVQADAWYVGEIAKAKAAGYIGGYPDGSMKPDNPISRQEAAAILTRITGLVEDAGEAGNFTDAEGIPDWSKSNVGAVAKAGYMRGYPDGSFQPAANITRAEAVVVLDRSFPIEPVVASKTINSPGIYGPDAGAEIFKGNVIITAANVTLRNMIIEGDLTITESVGDGDVYLKGVTVKGNTFVQGGGNDSVYFEDSVLVNVVIDKQDGNIRIVVSGTEPVNLGTAGDYAILAKTAISTVPTSAITGNIGVSPSAATYITGFALEMDSTGVFSNSSQITGKVYAADYTAPTPSELTTAISNMETAYTDAAGRAPDYTELHGGDISDKTLAAGVYKWGTDVLINEHATLDGGADDVWIFQIAQGITQANGKSIILSGGAQAKNIFWQAAKTVAIGTDAHFEGTILGMTNITLGTGASINGRLLAQTAVTLDKSTVVIPLP